MTRELTALEKALVDVWPRPAVGAFVLWHGYICEVLDTPLDASPIQVRVRREDGWMDLASTVHLGVANFVPGWARR